MQTTILVLNLLSSNEKVLEEWFSRLASLLVQNMGGTVMILERGQDLNIK